MEFCLRFGIHAASGKDSDFLRLLGIWFVGLCFFLLAAFLAEGGLRIPDITDACRWDPPPPFGIPPLMPVPSLGFNGLGVYDMSVGFGI